MPYIIKKVKNGYKVCKKDNKEKCFSNSPLSLKRATKQRTAIVLTNINQKGAGSPSPSPSPSPPPPTKFLNQLSKVNLTPKQYLEKVKAAAQKTHYDPTKLSFCKDNVHKITYDSPEGIKHFGRIGYGDFIIWSAKESLGEVPKGYAEMKRHTFRKSHSAISKIHHLSKYSPNELAINLLW
jgi:hypothetical protein